MLEYERQLQEQKNDIAKLQEELAEERRLSQLAAQSAWRDISEITFAEGDRYLLANLIYCEAGNQPYEGQVAVGAVVMNRVMSSVFPDTVVGVIYQNRQFSPPAGVLLLPFRKTTQPTPVTRPPTRPCREPPPWGTASFSEPP